MKRGLYRDINSCDLYYYTGRGWYVWLSRYKSFGVKMAGGWITEEKWAIRKLKLQESTPLEFLLLTGDVYKRPTPIVG